MSGDTPEVDPDLGQLSMQYDLTVRALNICRRAGLFRLSDIRAFALKHGGFRKLQNCGAKTQNELKEMLLRIGYASEGRGEGHDGTKISGELVGVMRGDPVLDQLHATYVLSVRAYNVCFNAGLVTLSRIRAYAQKHGSFHGLRNCGATTRLELEDLVAKAAQDHPIVPATTAMSGLARWALEHDIDSTRLEALYNEEGSMTLLRFLSSYLKATPATAKQRVYSMLLHGSHGPASFSEIGQQHGITRERVRQLLNGLGRKYPAKLAFVADLPGMREQYPELITDAPVFIADHTFAHRLNEKEGTDLTPLFMLFLTVAINAPRYVHCSWSEVFGRSVRAKELDHASPFMVEHDLKEPLRRVGVALASRYGKKRKRPERSAILAGVVMKDEKQQARMLEAMRMLLPRRFPDIAIRDGAIVLPPTSKPAQEDLLEDVLTVLDAPSHVTEILEKWGELFPDAPITTTGIRTVAVRNRERFFSVGRASTYGLRRWEAERALLKGGTIRDIIAEFLERSPLPLHYDEILEEVRKYRPTTYTSSIRTNMQLDVSGRFVFLPNGFVGLADRHYEAIPMPPAKVPASLLRKAVLSRFVGQHRRKLSEYITTRCKAAPERIELAIDNAIRKGRLRVDWTGHIREIPGASTTVADWTDELPFDW